MANSIQRPDWLNPNKPENRALLDTIRRAEGTWANGGDNGYRTNFGGGLFNDLSRHPKNLVSSGRHKSDAAGAYQFLSPTWQEQANRLNLKDFSKESQDIAALDYARQKLMAGRGDAVGGLAGLKGQLSKDQFAALGKAWAGLPFSPYGQTNTPNDQLASDLNSFYSKRLKELQAGTGATTTPADTTQAATTKATATPVTPTSPTITQNEDGSRTVSVPGGVTVNIGFGGEKKNKDTMEDRIQQTIMGSLFKNMTGGIDINKIANTKLYPTAEELLA